MASLITRAKGFVPVSVKRPVKWICDRTSVGVEYLGGWANPQNQQMLLFTKG